MLSFLTCAVEQMSIPEISFSWSDFNENWKLPETEPKPLQHEQSTHRPKYCKEFKMPKNAIEKQCNSAS